MGRYVRPRPARLTEKLLKIRASLELSQNGMLDRLGLSETLFRSSISSYERGASEPPLPILLQYARLAGVCLDVLVDDTQDLPRSLPGTPRHKGGRASHSRTKRFSRRS
jgi:transcriptional regulator with XRE-family HTH domain